MITKNRPLADIWPPVPVCQSSFPSAMDGFSVLAVKLILFSLIMVVNGLFCSQATPEKEKKNLHIFLYASEGPLWQT
jgi:hypothetical protein